MVMILCSIKSYVHSRPKFLKYIFPEKVAFILVTQGNNLENVKNRFDSFFLLIPRFFKKVESFPFYIFRNYHFDGKFIISLSIAFHNIQYFSSMVNDFHLFKLQISSQNTQCFKANILTLCTRIRERCDAGGWGWVGDLISLYSSFFYFFGDKNLLKQAKYFAPQNKNLTSWSINNAKIH